MLHFVFFFKWTELSLIWVFKRAFYFVVDARVTCVFQVKQFNTVLQLYFFNSTTTYNSGNCNHSQISPYWP